jgi:CubicO group peptidase (beta-lactamase class C family)
MRKYITLFSIFLFNIQLQAQHTHLPMVLDSIVESEAGKKNFSGSVMVIEEGDIILSKSVGSADNNHNIKNDLNTKFNIASVGKLFTKIVILQLAEEGSIKFTDSIGHFFPGFESSPAIKITVADLLNHRAGLGDVYNSREYRKLVKNNEPEFQEKVVSVISKEKLKFIPGTKTAYSNSGYYLLGAIASIADNKSFEAVIADRIFKPLTMDNSGFAKTGDDINGHAIPYKYKSGKLSELHADLIGDRPSGAGSQYSTAPDLAKIYLSVLYDNVLIKEHSKGLLFNNLEPIIWADMKKSGKIVGFVGGDTRGWSAKITFYLLGGKNYGVIIVSNFDNMAHELDLKLRPIILSAGSAK